MVPEKQNRVCSCKEGRAVNESSAEFSEEQSGRLQIGLPQLCKGLFSFRICRNCWICRKETFVGPPIRKAAQSFVRSSPIQIIESKPTVTSDSSGQGDEGVFNTCFIHFIRK